MPPVTPIDLSDDQIHRYARHLILDPIGEDGQARLLAARVLMIGAGGLGAPVLQYLAAAGVGHLTIVDDDHVDLANLQRQVIHRTADVGRAKVESAADAVRALNPDVAITTVAERFGPANAARLVNAADIIVDGSDNFATRYLTNDAAWLARKPLVAAALLRFEGQLFVMRPDTDPPSPCYRCAFPEPPPPGAIPRCEEAGILASLPGVLGTLQATEVLKIVLGLGASPAGAMLLYDGLRSDMRRMTYRRRAACALCGDRPTIRDLSAHDG